MLCNLFNLLLNLPIPVACTALEASVPVEDRCHAANDNLWIAVGVRLPETFDYAGIVAEELIAVVGPVAWVGVVEAQVDYHNVGSKLKCGLVFWQRGVWAVSFVQQGCTRMPEIAHLVLLAEQLLQLCGVGGLCRVLVPVSVCYTVAYTGNLYLLLRYCHQRQREQ